MKKLLYLCGLALAAAAPLRAADTRCFELRTYYAAPGKLDALLARFRDHTCKLFEKHGMTNVGYWIPVDNPSNELVYVLAFPSRAARDQAFKDFGADPEWQATVKTSEAQGQLVLKISSMFLQATDFSPAIKPSAGAAPRTFELRTYTCTPGRLPNLLQRFHEHTLALFAKHGMTNIAYWTPTEKMAGAGDTLIYLLAHPSREAADAAFRACRADPEWIKVKAESEQAAGGSLTITNGVRSEFLQPTDFSPFR